MEGGNIGMQDRFIDLLVYGVVVFATQFLALITWPLRILYNWIM